LHFPLVGCGAEVGQVQWDVQDAGEAARDGFDAEGVEALEEAGISATRLTMSTPRAGAWASRNVENPDGPS
jgi:hypothetical protein